MFLRLRSLSFDQLQKEALDQPDSFYTWREYVDRLKQQGRHQEEVAAIEHLLTIAPHSYDEWLDRGNILNDLHRHEEALDAYRHALALKPGEIGARYNQAYPLIGLGRFAEALTILNWFLGLEQGQNDGFALKLKAKALRGLGRKEEAAQVEAQVESASANMFILKISIGDEKDK